MTANLVTNVSEFRAGNPYLLGRTDLLAVPRPEAMWGGMRTNQKTGMTELYGRRFGESHQRSLSLFAQGVTEYKGKLLTSWYYKQHPAAYATKLVIVDPVSNMFGQVGLVTESGGVYVPSERHAGGIDVIGDYLYVADAPRGFHVYDLRDIYPVAGNESALSSHAAFQEYDYIVPRIGHIELTHPEADANISCVSISGDGQYFVCANYWKANSGYGGTKTWVFKIPIDTTVAEFPAAQVGVECEVYLPKFLSGSNAGNSIDRIQGVALTDTNVLILSRGDGTGTYQLIVEDLNHPGQFFNGNTVDSKNNDYKNWLYGCEDLSLLPGGRIATVTEFYDWRDVAVYSLADVIGLMGVYLPPTIAEHQAAFAQDLVEIEELQSAADFYQLQIVTAIAEGLTRFDEKTYLL